MGSADCELFSNGYDICKEYKGLQILSCNDQIKELQTILRDKYVSKEIWILT